MIQRPRRGLITWHFAFAVLLPLTVTAGQTVHEAPGNAPSTGRLSPAGEPGQRLVVSGVVVDAAGTPIPGASLYVYQTDGEGYYGVKPVTDSRNPRLKLFLRSDARGAWSFETIKPGSYPSSDVPGHIHFEVTAPGRAARIFEIVFEGDPLVTAQMRNDPAFSVRPIDAKGQVTDRIVLK
jgi:protocatechuate 3,4-dioxygenase beta subunit